MVQYFWLLVWHLLASSICLSLTYHQVLAMLLVDYFVLLNIYMYMLSCFSHVWVFATLWTMACQAPLSMGFSRREYWSELPCPPPGDLPNPGIEHRSPPLQVDSLPSEPPGKLRDSWGTVKVCFHRVHYGPNKKKLAETIQKQSFMSARTVSVLFAVIHHSLDLQHWGPT